MYKRGGGEVSRIIVVVKGWVSSESLALRRSTFNSLKVSSASLRGESETPIKIHPRVSSAPDSRNWIVFLVFIFVFVITESVQKQFVDKRPKQIHLEHSIGSHTF